MRRDWEEEIGRLNDSPAGTTSIEMGSSGSAQVTRVRLLENWAGLEAHTEGSRLILTRSGTERVRRRSGETGPADAPAPSGKPSDSDGRGLAREHYAAFGPVEDGDVGDPFDLQCRIGELRVHVLIREVDPASRCIEFSAGELEAARSGAWRTDLFLVAPAAAGERARVTIFQSWAPDPEQLTPTRYAYPAPGR